MNTLRAFSLLTVVTGGLTCLIDRWLAARPAGRESFWVKERLRFAQSHGRGDTLLQHLTEGVRQNPGDITNAITFLDALLYARQGTEWSDLSWFEGRVKPVRATHAKVLADRLRDLENWGTAVSYYQQAIAIPLTAAEIQELGSMRQVFISPDKLRAEIAVTAREAMAKCLLKLGRAEAARASGGEMNNPFGSIP